MVVMLPLVVLLMVLNLVMLLMLTLVLVFFVLLMLVLPTPACWGCLDVAFAIQTLLP